MWGGGNIRLFCSGREEIGASERRPKSFNGLNPKDSGKDGNPARALRVSPRFNARWAGIGFLSARSGGGTKPKAQREAKTTLREYRVLGGN